MDPATLAPRGPGIKLPFVKVDHLSSFASDGYALVASKFRELWRCRSIELIKNLIGKIHDVTIGIHQACFNSWTNDVGEFGIRLQSVWNLQARV